MVMSNLTGFKRKHYLGHYSGTKTEWKKAYKFARILKREGLQPVCSCTGIWWKAQLIVFNERNGFDWLAAGTKAHLELKRLTDDLLNERT